MNNNNSTLTLAQPTAVSASEASAACYACARETDEALATLRSILSTLLSSVPSVTSHNTQRSEYCATVQMKEMIQDSMEIANDTL